MSKEYVILVDEQNRQIGTMEKIEAHEKALLHRAFSIFIFNDQGELMLQQRAFEKYHSPGLWTNTCCSHQREGEETIDAAHRRLVEEMGFDTDLEEKFAFIYKAAFDNGLTEHEFDHVLVGHYNEVPKLNQEEAADWKWISLEDVKIDIELNPEQYTPWFRIIFQKYYEFIS